MTSKYCKFDYFRNSIFHSARGQLLMMLDEGHSLQEVSNLANELHIVINRALQMAGAEAVSQLGQTAPMPMPMPPQQEESDPEPDNPFVS